MLGGIRIQYESRQCDSLLRIISRICYYPKIEHSLYVIEAPYCEAVCAALDKVLVHDMAPNSMHQLALAVSFYDGCGCYAHDLLVSTGDVTTPPMVGPTWPRVRSALGSDCLPTLSQGTASFYFFTDLLIDVFVICTRMFGVRCPVILGLY